MEKLTPRAEAALLRLLSAEALACKKARAYANTLTDEEVACAMRALAEGHAARFAALAEGAEG